MGLSIVHGIITNHEGKITIYSESGIGTTFNVYLPCIKMDSSPSVKKMIDEKMLRGNERIIVVDDEEVIVKMYKKMLETFGYQVTALTSSKATLSTFQDRPDDYDLIITDMTMPNISGIELVEKIRNIRPEMPIILCTGFSELINKERADSLNINRYLMKPAFNQEMVIAVREVLDRNKIKLENIN